MVKRFFLIIVIIFTAVFIPVLLLMLSQANSFGTGQASLFPNADNPYKIRKVVIDAGHGGKDPGCIGRSMKIKEKKLTLAIALKVGKYIEREFDDVKVIYTRKTDKFVELHKRAAVANDNNADLFICIHCNAGQKSVYGTETYVMGLHKTKENLSVAKRENASILMEENYEAKYAGFDPNSPEANIIFALYQNAFLDQSLELASKIQSQFQHRAGRRNRGVKQAGFLVLYMTTMPSILIEAGFLSNAKEEKFLSSEKGQDYIASAIFRAFKEYKFEMDGVAIEDFSTPADTKNDQNIVFKVQLITSSKPIPLDSPKFEDIEGVQEYISDGWFKYIVGDEESLASAYSLQLEIRIKGFKSAFVVAFNDNERISLQEALKLLKL